MKLLFRYWVVWGNMMGVKAREVENKMRRLVLDYMMDLSLGM